MKPYILSLSQNDQNEVYYRHYVDIGKNYLKYKNVGAAFKWAKLSMHPTRALWEYACQVNSGWNTCNDFTRLITYNNNVAAGTPNGKFVQDDADATAWGSDTNYPGTFKGNSTTYAVVGSYSPNMIGLYDMHGNVREFCVDWANGYVRQSDQTALNGAANVDLSDYTMMRAWDSTKGPGNGTARFCAGSQCDTSLKGQTPNYTRQNTTVPNATGHGAGFRVIILED